MPLGQIEDSAFRTFIDCLLVKVRIAPGPRRPLWMAGHAGNVYKEIAAQCP